MVLVYNWKDTADLDNPNRVGRRKLLQKVDDLLTALNVIEPGGFNEFHYHLGTSQSFMCLQGTLTLRTKDDAEAAPETFHLKPGDCVLIPAEQYYQIGNDTQDMVVIYQVKPPGDEVVVAGRGRLDSKAYFKAMREGAPAPQA